MKHVYLVLSLGLLFFATACNFGAGKKQKVQESQPINKEATEIVSDLSQDYVTMDESRPAITGEIKDGGLWLTFHKDQILPIGITDENAYRLPNEPIQVEGLKGAPKNFIIADIGQDYNPILCVLTEEGKVQVLSLWNSVATGDVEVTEIPMNRIIGFRDGPGGPWEDEDGTVFYDYTTIYGIDARGNEHEVPLYSFDNDLEYVTKVKNTDLVYQLYFSDDWKMRYVVGYYLSEKVEELLGRFWVVDENWDDMIFTFGYELTTHLEYTGEDIITTQVKQTGVFKMQYPDFDTRIHIITPIEGIDFGNKGLNEPVPFSPSSAYGG